MIADFETPAYRYWLYSDVTPITLRIGLSGNRR
jgi:hypothetical protein